MKIRTGFVSNSSSSSFVIYGIASEDLDINKLLKKKVKEGIIQAPKPEPEDNTEENEDDEDWDDYEYEMMEELAAKVGLQYHKDYDNGTVYIGINPFNIKDNETGAQFKARVKKTIEDLLGKKVKCEQIEEVIQC